MKILEIKPHASYGVCDDLLSEGFYSDALFDKCFIEINIDMSDNVKGIFYRKLWEDNYIKIDHSITRLNGKIAMIGITLSEAISFIYKATPPRLQYNIKDSHKDIASVIETLKTFLMGEQSYITFTSMFYDHIHLKAHDMKQENFTRLKAGSDLIKSTIPNDKPYGFYVYASTHSIEKLACGDDLSGKGPYITMACVKLCENNPVEIIDLFNKITDSTFDNSVDVKVDNIKCVDGSLYISIMIVIDPQKGSYNYMPGTFADIIKYSYENFK